MEKQVPYKNEHGDTVLAEFDSHKSQRPMSDTELAAQYKHDMTLALQAVTLIMDRARAQGLIVGFVNIGMTQSGKYEASGITVARYF